MKNLLSIILSITLMLTFVSCTSAPVGDIVDKPATGNQSLPSKKNVEYPIVYSSLEEIDYDMTGLLGATQIEDNLYLLKQSGIYKINLADGTNSLLVEIDGLSHISSNSGYLYAFDNGENIYKISVLGEIIETLPIPEDTFDEAIFDNSSFIATDDYFVVACINGKKYNHFYFSKSDMSVEINATLNSQVICTAVGNTYYTYTTSTSGMEDYVISYDIASKKKGDRYIVNSYPSVIGYDMYSENVLLYGEALFNSGATITEFNLEDLSLNELAIFSIDGANQFQSVELLTVYNNLYCAIYQNSNKIFVYDMTKEYEELNIAVLGYSTPEIEYLSYLLGTKHDINVKVKRIDMENQHHLGLKLMAGDDDIDIFYTMGLDLSYYIESDCFVDLKEFDVLEENLNDARTLLENGFSYEGKIFGIPFSATEPIVRDCMQIDKKGSYTLSYNQSAYAAKYINAVEDKYNDDGGKMLYDLMMHFYDNRPMKPLDSLNAIPPLEVLCEDTYVIESTCYVMNPNGKNKDNAALFLNELMNVAMKKSEILGQGNLTREGYFDISYYDLTFDYSKCYPEWISQNSDAGTVLYQAFENAKKAEKRSEVKALAKECYNKIRQIILE